MTAQQPTIHVGIIDHLPPDVQAMMVAMYSRSYGPITSRLPETEESMDSLRQKLEKYYVGWGHKAVGQLGTTTIFLEGVSQLAAKAIEHNQLYNGQESSTRYIDFSTQPMHVPDVIGYADHNDLADLVRTSQERLRAIYVKALPLVRERLSKEYPCDDALTSVQTWTNTIKARTFDICRSILPAGATTNVAFCGTFDTINDHFGEMLYHPLPEMRAIAERVISGLQATYPHATPGVEALKQRFDYIARASDGDPESTYEYFYPAFQHEYLTDTAVTRWDHSLGGPHARRVLAGMLSKRKKWDKLPVANYSSKLRFTITGNLDFGSFRDLHRHRNGVCAMPMLNAYGAIEKWYVEQLPPEIVDEIKEVLADISLATTDGNMVYLQYAVPMGVQVPIAYDCDYNQLAYLIELRTGKTVHQTLRHFMQRVWSDLIHQDDVPLLRESIYPDLDSENFTLKRGQQTFSGEFK